MLDRKTILSVAGTFALFLGVLFVAAQIQARSERSTQGNSQNYVPGHIGYSVEEMHRRGIRDEMWSGGGHYRTYEDGTQVRVDSYGHEHLTN